MLISLLGVSACGYHPVDASLEGRGYSVSAGPAHVADAMLAGEAVSGVRATLARLGALASDANGYPRVVVEVLRVDAGSEAIAAYPGGRSEASLSGLPLAKPGDPAPLARATRVAVVGRAWIEREPRGLRERETGDIRASDTMAVERSAAIEALRYDDATHASARRLGERLARIVIGLPDASDDGM